LKDGKRVDEEEEEEEIVTRKIKKVFQRICYTIIFGD
jgi:hypothetical protein